jgi:uncharacterized membrane protein
MPKVYKEIDVRAPVDVVYGAWHNFENFPRFMRNIEEVRVVGGARSHWKARGPLGADAEWDAEMTLDEPGRAIGWRSIEGKSSVKTAGRVNFEGRDGFTHLAVVLEYDAPAGPVGDVVTRIFADPERQIEDDLNRFKQEIERGREASGFAFEPVQQSGVAPGAGLSAGVAQVVDNTDKGETLGGSMGGVTEEDLEAIDRANSGVEPGATDDPAVRHRTGEEFGESQKRLPDVGPRS